MVCTGGLLEKVKAENYDHICGKLSDPFINMHWGQLQPRRQPPSRIPSCKLQSFFSDFFFGQNRRTTSYSIGQKTPNTVQNGPLKFTLCRRSGQSPALDLLQTMPFIIHISTDIHILSALSAFRLLLFSPFLFLFNVQQFHCCKAYDSGPINGLLFARVVAAPLTTPRIQ